MSAGSPSYRTDTPSALPPGTRLGEFELLSLLGVGGFGIVYLAFDHALEREVAIKEYMPATLAGRTETMHVTLRSHSDAESFALGLKSFVNEAKLLARFDHPSLLKVHRFWEANGTAYMAMPVLRGRNLKEIRAEMGATPDEAWMRRILLPLLGAVEKLHSEDVFHRDIAPDNIQIEPDGRPVLLDFGAARRVLSDKSQALTAILKPAYAPIEQYGEAGSVKQGPWTDLYALGATLHFMLLGRPPAPATARTVHDEGSSLTPEALPGCSDDFLQTIDWMLCPRPTDRPQSVAEVRQVLEGKARPPARRPIESAPVHWVRTSVQNPLPGEERIDLDVGDDATQLIARSPAPAAAADHIWLEPDRAVPAADAERTMVLRGGGAAAAPGPVSDFAADSVLPVAPAAAVSSKRPLMLALGAMALIAAAVWMWQRQELPAIMPVALPSPPAAASAVAPPAPAGSSATAAAATSPAVESAASGTGAATAAGGSASQAGMESGIPTVVVAPTAPARRAEPSPRPAATAADKPGTARHSGSAGSKPVEPGRIRAEPVAPSPAAAVAPVPAGPGPSCGPREGVRYLVCMERECGTPEFASHPGCQRWKQ